MKFTTVALLAASALVSIPALACDSLGENMHMGSIVSIDRSNYTFVIKDAESRKPIRFSSSADALKPFDVNEMVEVGYEVTDGGELRAVSLKPM